MKRSGYRGSYKKGSGYLYKKNKIGFKVFRDEVEYSSELSAVDRGRFLDLCSMGDGNTQRLVYKSNGVYKKMTIEYIRKRLEIGRTKCCSLIKDYIRLGMLKRDSEGYLVVNPKYGMRSKYLSSEVYELFEDELGSELSQWVVRELISERIEREE